LLITATSPAKYAGDLLREIPLYLTGIAAHQQPASLAEHLATWLVRERIPVPARKGAIMALHIYLLIEATALNGLAVDAVLHARATKRAPTKSFCVVFRDKRPLDEYPIPLLWIKGCESVWLI